MIKLMPPEKQSYLTPFDLIILTLILLAPALVQSTLGFLDLSWAGLSEPESLTFDNDDNYHALVVQGVQFIVAWFYLRVRRFDWRTLDFNIDKHTLTKTLLLIVSAGLMATVFSYGMMWLMPSPDPIGDDVYGDGVSSISLSLVLFSLFNGFYEEIFFLGFVFATQKRYHHALIVISLLLRFLVHTYQGLVGAFVVMMLGVVFLLFRKKIKSLVPFMLAHAFFDVFGLGLWFLFPQ